MQQWQPVAEQGHVIFFRVRERRKLMLSVELTTGYFMYVSNDSSRIEFNLAVSLFKGLLQ